MNLNPESEHVAAVCDTEVRIYGPMNKRGIRPLIQVLDFNNYGQARLFAQEYDEISAKG